MPQRLIPQEPTFGPRPGEMSIDPDPAKLRPDAHLVFIGRVVSPWKERAECPKNMRAARETGKTARIEIAAPYRAGLADLAGFTHVVLLTWLDRSPRNLIIQKPRHAERGKGVFSLRSPARPNPIGLHVVKLLGLDAETGSLDIDAIDVLDGTPVLDLKPYLASIDAFPEAAGPAKD